MDGHASSDPEAMDELRKRWAVRLPGNRDTGDDDYQDEWYDEQCGSCRYWFPFAGQLGLDWGACANPRSPFDGLVRFEHDGCDQFHNAGQWVVPDDM